MKQFDFTLLAARLYGVPLHDTDNYLTLLRDYHHAAWTTNRYDPSEDPHAACATCSFFHVLRANQNFNASDDRDKVYASLGMLHKNIVAGLAIDYAKPLEGVYEDVIKHLIAKDGTLECLDQTGLRQSRNLLGPWPSWVIDWRLAKAEPDISKARSAHEVYCGNLPHDIWSGNCLGRAVLSQKAVPSGQLILKGWIIGYLQTQRSGELSKEDALKHSVINFTAADYLARIALAPPSRKPSESAPWNQCYVLLPEEPSNGDLLVILDGSIQPFLLRPAPVLGHFKLVGSLKFPLCFIQRDRKNDEFPATFELWDRGPLFRWKRGIFRGKYTAKKTPADLKRRSRSITNYREGSPEPDDEDGAREFILV